MSRPHKNTSRNEERDTARAYEFFRDQCAALKRRNQHFAVHPTDEKEMDELRERVKEDEAWNLGEPPRILPISGVPKGEVRVVDAQQVLSMREAMRTNRGLGRFQRIYVPSYARKRMD